MQEVIQGLIEVSVMVWGLLSSPLALAIYVGVLAILLGAVGRYGKGLPSRGGEK